MKWLFGLAVVCAGPAAAGCVSDPAPCKTDDGEYHAVMPDGVEAPPMVVFLHGAGGDGSRITNNLALMQSLTSRGYAVVAPTGSRTFREGNGRLWNFFPDWDGRDEADFLKSVVEDAQTRLGVRADNVLLAGFSAGAFMVTYLACSHPAAFSAYAPVAGGFWRPQPGSCAGPVNLFQTHGWQDTLVPLEGRFMRDGRFQQGDIMAGLELWRQTNECLDEDPDAFDVTGEFWRRSWACDGALELALFPGGHSIPKGWTNMVLDWFEALEP